MGNHPRAAKVPDHGVVPMEFDPWATRACARAGQSDVPSEPGQAMALEALRLFALVVADVEVPDDVYEEADEPLDDEEPVQGDGQPGEVVAWGLSFPFRAVVFLHNPLTGRDDVGIFDSPARARAFYSLFGDLNLTYV